MFDRKRKSEILKLINKEKAKRVLIQVPEGLKTGAKELMDFLEKKDLDVFLSLEPCFGACDLRDHEAKILGCDVVLHLGHKDLGLRTKVPVIYYEYFMDFNFTDILKEMAEKIKFRKLCLVTTVQFVKNLESAKKFLEKGDFDVCVGGEILGCDVSNAKRFEKMADGYLFIGSGRFHPLGLQEKVNKPVLFLDIENQSLEDLSKEKDRLKIKREMRIQKARGLRNFGVIISSNDAETCWNALRYANFSLDQKDEVKVFFMGKGVEYQKISTDKFRHPLKVTRVCLNILGPCYRQYRYFDSR